MNRHPCIKHWSELQEQEPRYYSGSQEPLSRGCALGKHFGFSRIGIHHEIVEPGHRTSWPHAEKTEDEFVHVLEGTPRCLARRRALSAATGRFGGLQGR